MQDLTIQWHGEELALMPERAVYWPAGKTLFVADVHLGKSRTFRRHGIPVSESVCAQTLDRLHGAIQRVQPDQLVILGDLLHHRTGHSEVLERELAEIPIRHGIGVQWVIGNHDQWSGVPAALAHWCCEEDKLCGPWRLRHHPDTADTPTLAGHIHPGVSVPLGPGAQKCLACFWIMPNQIVLPAFAGFAGTSKVEIGDQDWVAIPIDNRVFAVKAGNTNRASLTNVK